MSILEKRENLHSSKIFRYTVVPVCILFQGNILCYLYMTELSKLEQSVRYRPRPSWYDRSKFGIFSKSITLSYSSVILLLFISPSSPLGSVQVGLHGV